MRILWSMIYIFPQFHPPPTLHLEAILWLRNKFLKNFPNFLTATRRRLYISRSDSGIRRIQNEDEIYDYLKNYGFEKIQMSSITVTQQIDAFRNAEKIIFPHGGAGAFLLFCSNDCEVIEIHSPAWLNNCYFFLCKTLNISYKFLIGSGSNSNFDYVVDLSRLKTFFD